MNPSRFIVSLTSLLLAALLIFPILFLLAVYLIEAPDPYALTLKASPLLLCFIAGTIFGRYPRLKYAALPASLIAALPLIAFSLPWSDASYVYIPFLIAAASLGILLFFIAPVPGDALLPAPLIFSNVAFPILILFNPTGNMELLTALALSNFVLSFFSFNLLSVKNGIHNAKGQSGMRAPPGVQRKNLLLVCIFLLLACLIGYAPFVQYALKTALGLVGSGLLRILLFVSNLSYTPEREDTPVTPSPAPVEDALNMTSDGSAMTPLLILVPILIAMFVVLISAIQNKEKLSKFFRSFKKQKDDDEVESDYEESIERLQSLRSYLRKKGEDAAKLGGRILKRQERFEDMPNNVMKVRFVYKEYLKSEDAPKYGVPKTPIELAATDDSEILQILGSDYTEVRYAERTDISDQAALNAKLALPELRKRRKGHKRIKKQEALWNQEL